MVLVTTIFHIPIFQNLLYVLFNYKECLCFSTLILDYRNIVIFSKSETPYLITINVPVTVVRGTLPGADVRLLLSAGDPPPPFWPWGGENLLHLSPPVKETVQ